MHLRGPGYALLMLTIGWSLAACTSADDSGLGVASDGGPGSSRPPVNSERPADGGADAPAPGEEENVCPAPLSSCGTEEGSGAALCANLANDEENCGACGRACAAGRSCQGGACDCPVGRLDCAGACVNPETDSVNCGACGTACPAGQVCSRSRCTTACDSGLNACAAACVDLASDEKNCG